MEEVVVTGTLIRGQAPVGAQLLTISRAEIDATGLTTVQDVIRTLPQNFAGGVSEDTVLAPVSLGREAQTNSSRASAINLRGLGAGATLVLLNGRRLAPGGTRGAFTDVSGIPLSAVERIEVLPDGASALYGSDAIGGVVNLVLRSDFSGLETQATFGSVTDGPLQETQLSQLIGGSWEEGNAILTFEYRDRDALLRAERPLAASSDLRPFGGSNFDTLGGNPGTIQVGGQTYAIPRGQNGQGLTADSLTAGTRNLHNVNESVDLVPQQSRWAATAMLEQSIGTGGRLFIDGLYSERDVKGQVRLPPILLSVPNTNPSYVNPTGGTGPVQVQYSFHRDLGPNITRTDVANGLGTVGWEQALAAEWQVRVSGSYGREDEHQSQSFILDPTTLGPALADSNPATALNPFGDGSFTNPATLARLYRPSVFEKTTDLRVGNLLVDGPLFELPGGAVRIAVGAEYRDEGLDSRIEAPGRAPISSSHTRMTRAAFSELTIPFVDERNAIPGIRDLRLSAAGRYERYSDFGSETVPKFGIAWSPIKDLSIRGTWSESFKAPNVADLDEMGGTFSLLQASVADPLSPTGTSSVLRWTGSNADLRAETGEIQTIGVAFHPEAVPMLSADLTYYTIDFNDRVESVSLPATVLSDPRFAIFVTRNPTAEHRQMVCSRSQFLSGPPSTCLTAPIAAILDARLSNVAVTETSGFDFVTRYGIESGVGRFDFTLNANYTREYEQARLLTQPLVEILDTQNSPLRFRGRASLGWSRDTLGLTAYVNYTDSYKDVASQPARRVDSWTTIDLQVRYQFPEGFAEGLSLSLSVQNLLDEDPPFLNSARAVGYDLENADLLGRYVTFTARKHW